MIPIIICLMIAATVIVGLHLFINGGPNGSF